METSALLSKIKNTFPDAVLEHGRFGRSGVLAVWIEAKSIQKIADYLKAEPTLYLDWLENLSAMQMDGALVLSYFLRSYSTDVSLVVRVSLEPSSKMAPVGMPTLSATWPMALQFEPEIQELFGIQFQRDASESQWTGYPLRKEYVFPKSAFSLLGSGVVP